MRKFDNYLGSLAVLERAGGKKYRKIQLGIGRFL